MPTPPKLPKLPAPTDAADAERNVYVFGTTALSVTVLCDDAPMPSSHTRTTTRDPAAMLLGIVRLLPADAPCEVTVIVMAYTTGVPTNAIFTSAKVASCVGAASTYRMSPGFTT